MNNARAKFDLHDEFLAYLPLHGVKRAQANYITWMNRAGAWLGGHIGVNDLASETDVERVIGKIRRSAVVFNKLDETHLRCVLKKYAAMVRECSLGALSMPDEPVLTLEWLDDDSRGYTDYYPVSWFAKEGERKAQVHITRGPKGGVYRAQCDLRVAATTAEFDYAAYPDFNEDAGMFLGVARLTFRDAKRTEIVRAEWRGERGSFKKSPIRTEQRASPRPELSATDDLPHEAPPGCGNPKQRSGTTRFFVRDEKVRQAVLRRAEGKCEFCQKLGFLTAAGQPYLETHHITALAKDGPDTMDNVIALCANDHREAHFGQSPALLATRMLNIVKVRQTEYLAKQPKR